MKVNVESLGLPAVTKLIGRRVDIDFPGDTLADLIGFLAKRYGQPMRKALLDTQDELDVTIQVMLNDEGHLARDQYSKRALKDGDRVIFMILVGGG